VGRIDAPEAAIAPIVDGVVDPMWAQARQISTTIPVIGSGGATATAKLLWDSGYLYVLVNVADPVLDESSTNLYEQDSVEIFVDPDNGKTTGFDDDDGQYRISFSNRQSVDGGFAAADNLTSATAIVPGGYVVEARIQLDTIHPASDSLLGFELQVNDATGGRRTAASTWHDPTGVSYVNTSRWGVLRLTKH
jgi:endo-1,4-beta-xylanase